MEIYIARQPIFTAHQRLFAYELLYRGNYTSNLRNTSGNRATTSVLSSAFLTEGIDKISSSRPCFINFTRELLLLNLPAAFPKHLVVVEVLEDVPPTPDVVAICQKLRADGYTLALDDFVYDPSLDPLIKIAHIIKFDFQITPAHTLAKTLHRLAGYPLKFLAEKVETHEEFEQAVRLGFSYLQGYFFAKPEKIRIREIDSAKVNLVALLAEVNQKTTTRRRLEKIIQNDVGITYKLLRFINSSYFYRLQRIESVAHAITYLGEKEIRRFIILVVISELASNKPAEIIRLALVRARMGELIAGETAMKEDSDQIFLLGLFSLLDGMLDTSIDYICESLSLSDNLTNALVTKSGPYAPYLDLLLCYEQRDKDGCVAAAAKLKVNPSALHQHYLDAITFASSIFG